MDLKAFVMTSGGRGVLRLMAPADADCKFKDGMLAMKSRAREVQVWLVRGAQTVDDAVGRVDKEITAEFKDFNATSTAAMTVAGTPAKRLMGTGVEADDGDPGTADIIVFKVGANIFVACTHGEILHLDAQEWMLTLVQGAQVP